MPHARAREERVPFACDMAEAGLLRSLSLTLLGFFTSSKLLHAASPTSSRAASRRPGAPSNPRASDAALPVFIAWPSSLGSGSKAEACREGDAARQSQSERIDAFAEVVVDPAQVRPGAPASVLVELGVDAGIAGPQRQIAHRHGEREVPQPQPAARDGSRDVIGERQLAPPQELAVLALVQAVVRGEGPQLEPFLGGIHALLRRARGVGDR